MKWLPGDPRNIVLEARPAVEILHAGLEPVPLVDPYHCPGLVVLVRVGPAQPHGQIEVAAQYLAVEMAVIADVPVACGPPEVRARVRGDREQARCCGPVGRARSANAPLSSSCSRVLVDCACRAIAPPASGAGWAGPDGRAGHARHSAAANRASLPRARVPGPSYDGSPPMAEMTSKAAVNAWGRSGSE